MNKFKNYPNEMLRLVTLVITLALLSSLFGHSEASAGFDDRQGWDVRLSTGKKFSSDARTGAGVWINDFGGPSAGYMLTGDFDGDGKTDIAGWNPYVAGWDVALSSGTGFDKEGGGNWIEGFGYQTAGYMLTGDFNGDGKTDIAGWNESVQGWHVALSTGHSFDPAVGNAFWIEGFGYPFAGYMLTGNFDGDSDGKTDIAGWNESIQGWHVALSTGHSFDPAVGNGFWIEGFGAPDPGIMLTGDFNGDGKTDIAGWNDDIQGWHVALSTGHSFDPAVGNAFWIEGFGYPFAGYMLTGDFDGDGKTDIAGWNVSVQGWHVALSTGHSFDPSKEGGGGFWAANFGNPSAGYMLTGNFNGKDDAGKLRTDIASWNSLRRPEAPDALTVTSEGETALGLSWFDNSHNEKGFRIHFTGGGFIDAKRTIDSPHELGLGWVSYTITGLIADKDLTIYVTAYNDLGESTPSEKVHGHTKPPKTPPPSLPDIVLADVWMEPAFPEPGEKFTLYWSLYNAGGSPTGKFTNRLERDNTVARGGPEETRSIMTDSLSPGGGITQSAEYASGLPMGDHFWYVYLDYDNKVKESNEDNNIGSLGAVSFIVEPLMLSCPASFVITTAQGQTSAVVNYPPPTANHAQGTTVTCSPPSGSSFPIGRTTVTCTAIDSSGNTATCSFIVNVFE